MTEYVYSVLESDFTKVPEAIFWQFWQAYGQILRGRALSKKKLKYVSCGCGFEQYYAEVV